MTAPEHRNRLATETSPYLIQHAGNPVDWFPWSEEAFRKAREEDKPVLLSIGYSACHWCHVMEHESFESESIAGVMNEHFVSIKVDREERPDIDQIYMSAVQLMTGSGGWPLTVFLTPDARPFYGGTYFPPDDRYNRPGFRRVLAAIAEAWRERREDVTSNAVKLVDQIASQAQQTGGEGVPDAELLDAGVAGIASRFDAVHGGFGAAPKFPSSMTIGFLLRQHARTGDGRALEMANLTLEKMALGGLYDQIGGGFHRYSTDERWLVPHFEKMLYDNALLARVYLDAFRLTGRTLYRDIVVETLDFVARELLDGSGGFYSTLDADSEGVEGKFYVWDLDEFSEVVGEDAEWLAQYWDVTANGNFEGRNIVNVPVPLDAFRNDHSPPGDRAGERISNARRKLFEPRGERVRPARDEKILTDWNGMMLRAFADAAGCLDRHDYRRVAEANAEFLLATLWDGRRLLHAFKDGQARFNGYLDDYANLADGLLALYELTFEDRWLRRASEIAERMIDEFQDAGSGGFYFTGRSHESLVARTREYFDNATPSGNSVAADVLIRLGTLLERKDFRDRGEAVCRSVTDYIRRFPTAFGHMLGAVDFMLGPSAELALVGDPSPFLTVVRSRFLPRMVIAAGSPRGNLGFVPLLEGRVQVDGKPTAYLCENYACRQPVTDPQALAALLPARTAGR